MRRYDVFLSHNSRDKPVVERIAERLKDEGLEPWLDKWCLVAGEDWQRGLADGIAASRSCAVFVGPSDLGAWANQEVAVALDRAAKDPGFRLFLVLLPGLPDQFEPANLLPFLRLRTWVDYRSGLENGHAFRSLVRAIQGLALGPEVPTVERDEIAPYRGLEVFDEEHAELFFGREADVQRVLEKLKGARFLAVVGASGSGKSSLVRAGVIPALRRGAPSGSDRWEIVVLRPGAHPLEALAAHLLRAGADGAMQQTVDGLAADERTLHLAASLGLAENPDARLLLVVDQFEEAFTLCRDEREREAFFANLLYAASVPDGRCAVVLTMRADFYHRCGAYPELAQALAAQQYLVSPLQTDGFRQAIEEPARAVGLTFEPGLVGTILEDVADEPGALPLLEHALLELWERRHAGMLALEGYRESGGVGGAIAQRAEEIFGSLTPDEQEVARRTFMRLTQPGEGTEDTRRRVRADELAPSDLASVVRNLVDARLLTTSRDEAAGGEVVEVAHEALIRGWPRLRRWIDEDRAGLRVHRRLTEAAQEWERLERDPSALYRGARLAEGLEWRQANADVLNELERAFLDASRAAERDAFERERRRTRRLRVLAGSLAVLLAAALAAGGYALQQRNQATAQERVARSRSLASAAIANLDNSPLAMLLGLEAFRVVKDDSAAKRFEARDAILTALQRNPRLRAVVWGVSPASTAYGGGRLAWGAQDGTVRVWDVGRRAAVGRPLRAHTDPVSAVALSRDGRKLATGDENGTIKIWNVGSRSPISPPWRIGELVATLAFSPNGEFLAAVDGGGAGVKLWSVAERAPRGVLSLTADDAVSAVAFSPDGRVLAAGSGFGTISLWDVATREPLGKRLRGHLDAILATAFTAGGNTIVSFSIDGTVRQWDVGRRTAIGKPLRVRPHAFVIASPDVLITDLSDDGTKLAFSIGGARITVYDVSRRKVLHSSLPGHADGMAAVTFSPDGSTLLSTGVAGTAKLWDVNPGDPFGSELGVHKGLQAVAFSPDGTMLASGGRDQIVRLWDVTRRKQLEHPLRGHTDAVHSLVFSPDGETLASGDEDGTIRLSNAAGRWVLGDPLRTGTDLLISLAFDPAGRTLASGGADVRLWDVRARTQIGPPLGGHEGGVQSVGFRDDGDTLVSASLDAVKFWDVGTQTPRGTALALHEDGSPAVALSPDAKTLAVVGGQANTVELRDLGRRRRPGRVLGVHAEVEAAAFSPDGATLVTGGTKGTIRLWDVARRAPLGEPMRGDAAWKLAFSPDGRAFAAAESVAGTITVWDGSLTSLDYAVWRRRLCHVVGRNLTEAEWSQFSTGPRRKTCPQYP